MRDNVVNDMGLGTVQSSDILKVNRFTDGYGDRGGVFGVITNNPNQNAQFQICEYSSVKNTSEYLNRDSVAEFLEINGANATITYTNTDITYTINTVKLPGCTILNKIKPGMVIDTLHSPNKWTSIVESINLVTKTITVKEGFYQVGNNSKPTKPTNGIGLSVNAITKIYANNTVVKLPEDKQTEHAVGYEIDLCKYKSTGSIGGIDLVNMGETAVFALHIHKAFEGKGFNWGIKVEDSEQAFSNTNSDENGLLLKSDIQGDDYLTKGFLIQNNGRISKLNLWTVIVDDSESNIPVYYSCILLRFSEIKRWNFFMPEEVGAGTIKFVKNISEKDVWITGSIFLKKDFTNDLLLRQGEGIVLLSDGATWHVLAEYNYSPSGYSIYTNTTIVDDLSKDTLIFNGASDINADINALSKLPISSKIYVKNIGTNAVMLYNSNFYVTSQITNNMVIEPGGGKILINNGNNAWFVI